MLIRCQSMSTTSIFHLYLRPFSSLMRSTLKLIGGKYFAIFLLISYSFVAELKLLKAIFATGIHLADTAVKKCFVCHSVFKGLWYTASYMIPVMINYMRICIVPVWWLRYNTIAVMCFLSYSDICHGSSELQRCSAYSTNCNIIPCIDSRWL